MENVASKMASKIAIMLSKEQNQTLYIVTLKDRDHPCNKMILKT